MKKVTYSMNVESVHSPEHFYAILTEHLGINSHYATTTQSLSEFTEALSTFLASQEQAITIIWKNHTIARGNLDYTNTLQYYEQQLRECPPSDLLKLRKDVRHIKRHEKGIFELVLHTFKSHTLPVNLLLQ